MSPRHSHLVLGLAVTSTAAMLWAAQVTAPGAPPLVPRLPLMPQQTRTLGPVFAQAFAPAAAPLIAIHERGASAWRSPADIAVPRVLVSPSTVVDVATKGAATPLSPSPSPGRAVVAAVTAANVVAVTQRGGTAQAPVTTAAASASAVPTAPVFGSVPASTVSAPTATLPGPAPAALASISALAAPNTPGTPVVAQASAVGIPVVAHASQGLASGVAQATAVAPQPPVLAVPAAVSLVRAGTAVHQQSALASPSPGASVAAVLSTQPEVTSVKVATSSAALAAVVAVSPSAVKKPQTVVSAQVSSTAVQASLTASGGHLHLRLTATVALPAQVRREARSLLAPRQGPLARMLSTHALCDLPHKELPVLSSVLPQVEKAKG